jgi:hypothetical protein
MAGDGGIQLAEAELNHVRQRFSIAHENLAAAARVLLRSMGRQEDLAGLMMDLHIHLDKNVFSNPDEDDFSVIRSDLRPVGVYIDPPGVCYPINLQ